MFCDYYIVNRDYSIINIAHLKVHTAVQGIITMPTSEYLDHMKGYQYITKQKQKAFNRTHENLLATYTFFVNAWSRNILIRG